MQENPQNSTEFDNSTRTPVWEAAFLQFLRTEPNVTRACLAVGIDRTTPYARREVYPGFAKAMDEAIEQGSDILEAEAWRRAVEGVEEPVYQGGKEVGRIQRYSDTLMMLLLKGHKPQKFRERISSEVSGPNGGPVEVSSLTRAELMAIAAQGKQENTGN